MGRSPCCEKVGLKKGPWTQEEDQKLLAYIEEHGHGSWRALPAKAGDYYYYFYQQLDPSQFNPSKLVTNLIYLFSICV